MPVELLRLGCNVNVCLWLDKFEETVQEVRASGQFTEEESIKREAHKRFMDQTYVPDVRSIVRERSGQLKVPSEATYTVTPQGLMVEQNGRQVPFDDMFVGKRREKGLEDSAETRILQLAQQSILSSPSAEVWFPVNNKENGEDKIRFIAHWKREGDKVIPEMIRIADNQGDKTLAQARREIRTHHAPKLIEISQDTKTFIFSNIPMENLAPPTGARSVPRLLKKVESPIVYRAETPIHSQEVIAKGNSKNRDIFAALVNQAGQTGNSVAKEIRITTARATEGAVVRFFQRGNKKEKLEETNTTTKSGVRVRKQSKTNERGQVVMIKPKEPERLQINRSGVTLRVHSEGAPKRLEELQTARIAILTAAKTGIGVGAAIWGVERLSLEKDTHQSRLKNSARRARSDQENRRRPRKEKSRAVRHRILPENVQATASPKPPKEKLVERVEYKKKRVSSEPKRTKKTPESHRKHLRIQKEPRRTAHNQRREIKPVRVEAKKRTHLLKERKALRQSRRKLGQHKDTAPRNFAKTITEKINRERNHERQGYHATKVEHTDRAQRLIDARTREVFIIFKKLMAAPESRVFAEEAAVSRQTLEPHQTKELPVRNEQRARQRKRAERSIVRRVTAAFILWFLLQPKEKAPRWKNRESVKIQKEEVRQGFRFSQERSPWLLFAIIWYLAMLREQAVRTRGKQAVKKPAAINVQSFVPSRRTQMPTQGVIFSLHS